MAKPPLSLFGSVVLGAIGFMVVSVAGFAPWALAGRVLHRAVGELGLYVVCALVFIGLSGAVLHRLLIGPGSLGRFYILFGVAFTVYAVGWIIGWMTVGGHLGSLVGLLLGTSAMGWTFVRAFDCRGELLKVIAVLFISNALGYFIGGWVEAGVAAMSGTHLLGVAVSRQERRTMAMLLWGVCYGLGFGAGLGLTFYICQARTRALLRGGGEAG